MINPYHDQVNAEANIWFGSFKLFTPNSQYAFDKYDVDRLASLVCAEASREVLRIGIDLMLVFFVIDEYTDVETAPAVCEMTTIIVDAIHNPDKPRSEGEVPLGEVIRQFWARVRTTATPVAAKHFVQAFTDYLSSVVTQAEDRDNDRPHTIDTYLETRRENIGMRPSYVLGELHLSIPDEAFYHPVIKQLEYLVADLVILDNDIMSYNKEQAMGDDRPNILTVAMHQFNVDFDGAMAWVVDYHEDVKIRFYDALKRVPSFDTEVDAQLQAYIGHLTSWPRGNNCWHFESGRYFGSRGLEYQNTHLVPMLCKRARNPALKRELVEVLLIDKFGVGIDGSSLV